MLWVLQMMQRLLSQFNHDRLNHSSINSTQVETRNSENRDSVSKTKIQKTFCFCHVHFDPSTSHSVLKSLETGSFLTLKLSFFTINNRYDNHFSHSSLNHSFRSNSLTFLFHRIITFIALLQSLWILALTCSSPSVYSRSFTQFCLNPLSMQSFQSSVVVSMPILCLHWSSISMTSICFCFFFHWFPSRINSTLINIFSGGSLVNPVTLTMSSPKSTSMHP